MPSPLNVVMHFVLNDDGLAFETGPQTFDEIVDDVRSGQYPDCERIIAVTFENGVGRAEDVTEAVALAILATAASHPVVHGSDGYQLIERELGDRSADFCAWEGEMERRHERARDALRRIRA